MTLSGRPPRQARSLTCWRGFAAAGSLTAVGELSSEQRTVLKEHGLAWVLFLTPEAQVRAANRLARLLNTCMHGNMHLQHLWEMTTTICVAAKYVRLRWFRNRHWLHVLSGYYHGEPLLVTCIIL